MTTLLAVSPADEMNEPIDLLDQARAVMPWVLSVAFHMGLLMLLMFFAQRWNPPPEHLAVAIPQTDFNDDQPMGEINFGDPGAMEEGGLVTALEQTLVARESRVTVPPAGPISDVPNPSPDPGGPKMIGGLGGDGTSIFIGPPQPANRIVYVIDRSGSMVDKFDYLRAKMYQSIRKLNWKQQFAVICFSDGKPQELTIDGQTGWHSGRAYNQRQACKWIGQVSCQSYKGGTDPASSLRRAFSLPGEPADVIYLLTDGRFNQDKEVVALLDTLNRQRRSRVCTISFVGDEGADVLKDIARRNKGVYTHVTAEDIMAE